MNNPKIIPPPPPPNRIITDGGGAALLSAMMPLLALVLIWITIGRRSERQNAHLPPSPPAPTVAGTPAGQAPAAPDSAKEPAARRAAGAAARQQPAVDAPVRWNCIVTAYCPCETCCGRWAATPIGRRRLASGAALEPILQQRLPCAAGPPEIAFGTLLGIPGYHDGRPTPVLDRGGAIRGDRIDVLFPTHAEALRWGRRRLTVTIFSGPRTGEAYRPSGRSDSRAPVRRADAERKDADVRTQPATRPGDVLAAGSTPNRTSLLDRTVAAGARPQGRRAGQRQATNGEIASGAEGDRAPQTARAQGTAKDTTDGNRNNSAETARQTGRRG